MPIFFGTRLFGKVDQVPGIFYVATRFFYIQFIPLVPVGSFLIIEGSENDGNFSGSAVGLSGKSIFFTYLRVVFLLGGVIVGMIGVFELIEAMRPRGSLFNAIPWLISCPIMLTCWWFSYRWAYAGEARALRLAALAGIPPEVIVEHFAPSGLIHAGDEQIAQVEPTHAADLPEDHETQHADDPERPRDW